MPLSVQDIFDLPYYSTPVRVSLEPARSVLQSMLMLAKAHYLSGVGDWVINTRQAMSQAERKTNDLVMLGFYYVVIPRESWNSFPAYLDHLANMEPEALRDKMLNIYQGMPPVHENTLPVINLPEALDSVDQYLAFLRQRFKPENVDEVIERQAYQYVMDPPALQQLVDNHLRAMWDKYLAEEWERVRPTLQTVVRAFQQMNLKDKTFLEAAQLITGQDLDPEKWEPSFAEARRLILVPHPHVGPYLPRSFCGGDELVVFFGAHLPEGIALDSPELSRAEIMVRLGALADDTRLRILHFVAEHGEQRSQEIIEALELSQSVASRHLTQLSAAGFLIERRCEGAKCYALNQERITDTLQAISNFLLVGERRPI